MDRYSVYSTYTLTNRNDLDDDNDGLLDIDEYNAGTDSLVSDTDGDGMTDGFEVINGLNPLDNSDATIDTDGDGLTNLEEHDLGTNPNDSDTDNDGMLDGYEIDNGFDPNDGSDCPSWMCGSSKVWLWKLQQPGHSS